MKELSQDEYEALAAFRHAVRQFLHFSECAARDAGLTPLQHQAVLAIKGSSRAGGVTVGDLAELLVSRPHSTTELVNRLQAQGLVEREQSALDARRVMIRLTERADVLLSQLSSAHHEEIRRRGPELIDLLSRIAEPPDDG